MKLLLHPLMAHKEFKWEEIRNFVLPHPCLMSAERDKYIQSSPEILGYNFLQFTSTFTQKRSKLER